MSGIDWWCAIDKNISTRVYIFNMRPECIYATLKIYVPEMLLDHFFDRRISMVTRCPTSAAPGRTHFQICNTKILHCNCDETQNDRKVYMCFFFGKVKVETVITIDALKQKRILVLITLAGNNISYKHEMYTQDSVFSYIRFTTPNTSAPAYTSILSVQYSNIQTYTYTHRQTHIVETHTTRVPGSLCVGTFSLILPIGRDMY